MLFFYKKINPFRKRRNAGSRLGDRYPSDQFSNDLTKNGFCRSRFQFRRLCRSSVSPRIFRQLSRQGHLRPGMCILMCLLAIFLNTAAAAAHRTFLQQGIAEEVLRFHVLANSDSEEDQAVKYLVRDAILAWAEAEMNVGSEEAYGTENTDETEEKDKRPGTKTDTGKEKTLSFYSENIDQIEAIANAVLIEQGMPYQATAEICESYFPDRTYGEYTFPAGWYQALRIRLGEAKGQNWWCLLYPGLCFSDALHAVIENDSQETLEEILTVEEYQSLLKTPSRWKITFRWFSFTAPS